MLFCTGLGVGRGVGVGWEGGGGLAKTAVRHPAGRATAKETFAYSPRVSV